MIGSQLFGTHIVGGEITYSRLSGNDYKVQLSLYVDCINGQPGAIAQDGYANISVFDGNTNVLLSSLCQSVLRQSPQRITKLNYKCIKNAPNACIDFYSYESIFNLPPNANGYIIAFQRCCRNNTINNIVDPQSTGVTFWTRIEGNSILEDDNSPVFNNLPPNFLCTNAPLTFDHSATDKDGDSLVYELFTPFLGADASDPRPDFNNVSNPPFSNILWQSSYNLSRVMDGSPLLTINRKTGLLTVTPTKTGQFVVGIRVISFRNGIRIGETKRDYQFNVAVCEFDIVSSYSAPAFNCSKTVVFTNSSTTGGIYHWDLGDPSTNSDTSSKYQVSWYYKKAGHYTVSLITTKNGCSDTFKKEIDVSDSLSPVFGNDTAICGKFKKTLGISCVGCEYKWNTGDSSAQIDIDKGGIYSVIVKRGYCQFQDTIEIKANEIDEFKSVNIFTPGHDGINDYFPSPGKLDYVKMKVYDRWGILIYKSDYGETGWDGKIKGKDPIDGVYYYLIEFKDCKNPNERLTNGVVHVVSEK